MRPHRTGGLLLLPLLFLLPAVYAAQSSALGIERQTELVDPRDAGWFYRPEKITIETEENNPYTGPFGQARIGSIVVNVSNAKVEETYNVRITDIRENQYTGNR